MYPEFQEDLRLFELSETSSASEVKSKYKLLAKVWHPDRFQHDEELCKEASKKLAQINNAYQRLKQHVESGNSFTVEEEYEEAEPNEVEEEEVVEAQVNENSGFLGRADGAVKASPMAFSFGIIIGVCMLFFLVKHSRGIYHYGHLGTTFMLFALLLMFRGNWIGSLKIRILIAIQIFIIGVTLLFSHIG